MFSLSLTAQSEEQQKQQKKAENSRSQNLELRPSFFYPTQVYPHHSGYRPVYERTSSSPSSFNYDLKYSIGLTSPALSSNSIPKPIGFYMTVINQSRGFYILARASKPNPNRYYNNITKQEANQWGDEYKGQYTQLQDLTIGILTTTNPISHLIAINTRSITTDQLYLDPTGILPYRDSRLYSIDRQIQVKIRPVYGIIASTNQHQVQLGIQTILDRQPTILVLGGYRFE